MSQSHDITPSQTIGPFPHEGWRWAVHTGAGALVVEGTLFDGDGKPVDDGWIEARSPAAAADGDAPLPGLRRAPTGVNGEFRFAVPEPPAGEPAAWITVFARGLLVHRFSAVFTRADAPLLAQVAAERRSTLLAVQEPSGHWRWDIHLQGPRETVFFDFA